MYLPENNSCYQLACVGQRLLLQKSRPDEFEACKSDSFS